MSEKFEIPKARRATRKELRDVARNLEGVRKELELDPTRGHVVEVESRRWTFVMTKDAVAKWASLGEEEIVIGVLAYHQSGLDAPYVQRELFALPGRGQNINLEMRDPDGYPLWKGRGQLKGGELHFSMPITRPGTTSKGVMAGRLNADGRMTLLKSSKLPKPTGKKKPALEAEN